MLSHLLESNKQLINATYKIHEYKGCGSIPKGMKTTADPSARNLLNQLPKLLNGYGQTFKSSTKDYCVVVICDLDKRNKESFLQELNQVLENCHAKPNTKFCLAIEEGEAWLLGDIDAIKTAYPKAKMNILKSYKNDSICNTWEKLADAIYEGGASKLQNLGYQAIGSAKCEWAEKITPHMNLLINKSPSFNNFLTVLEELKQSD